MSVGAAVVGSTVMVNVLVKVKPAVSVVCTCTLSMAGVVKTAAVSRVVGDREQVAVEAGDNGVGARLVDVGVGGRESADGRADGLMVKPSRCAQGESVGVAVVGFTLMVRVLVKDKPAVSVV